MKQDLTCASWGNFPKVVHHDCITPQEISEVKTKINESEYYVLPRGLGRSYGDSCLNADHNLLSTEKLNRMLHFDEQTGLLQCEAGVSLEDVLNQFVPKGWFLPVTPGTKFVTLGGAIANDVHGKNHHKAGNFSHHVTRFELLGSDGKTIECSREKNSDWFYATIGGLGLTGIILWAEFQLKPVNSSFIEMESVKFNNLDEFTAISRQSEADYEYTVSWIDCLSSGKNKGRGIFMRGNHTNDADEQTLKMVHKNSKLKTFPFNAPSVLLSRPTIAMFNFIYYHKQFRKNQKNRVHYDPFFYPLDSIHKWNRMYGKRGFLQWQCVVPKTDRNEVIQTILEKIIESKLGSFLAVLKEFGDIPSEGLLSFPMPGVTLALDFPNVGDRLFQLLDELDRLVIESGGRIYPAKDARMSAETFQASFSQLAKFKQYVDPKFSSSFYRRTMSNNQDK